MSEYKLTLGSSVIRNRDGASVPADPTNLDYVAFLAWVDAGGVPDPVDVPSHREMILNQIAALEASITDRRWREAGPDDAGGTSEGRAWLRGVSDHIATLRAGL